MANPLTGLWKEIRGSALWDGAKWLWATGGASVTAVWNATYQFLQGHKDWVSLAIAVSPVAAFALVAIVVAKTNRRASELEQRPMTQEAEALPREQNLIFHPFELGRRIESVVYGAKGQTLQNTPARVSAMKEGERLIVNHHNLDLEDPLPGEDDKFLTITLSETLRQRDTLISPRGWLNVNSRGLTDAPMLRVTQERIEGLDWLKFDTDKDVRYICIDPLLSVKTQSITPLTPLGSVQAGNYERCRVIASVVGSSGETISLLKLIDPNNLTSDSVTVHYEDKNGTKFSRTFGLLRQGESVEWKPKGLPMLRDA